VGIFLALRDTGLRSISGLAGAVAAAGLFRELEPLLLRRMTWKYMEHDLTWESMGD